MNKNDADQLVADMYHGFVCDHWMQRAAQRLTFYPPNPWNWLLNTLAKKLDPHLPYLADDIERRSQFVSNQRIRLGMKYADTLATRYGIGGKHE